MLFLLILRPTYSVSLLIRFTWSIYLSLSLSLSLSPPSPAVFYIGQLDVEYDEERNNPHDEYDPTKVVPGTEHLWLNEHGEKVYYDGNDEDNYDEKSDELEEIFITHGSEDDDIDMSLRI